MLKKIKIETKHNDVYDVTPEVRQAVEESGIQEGTCIIFSPHTTAGFAITSFWDPNGFLDLQEEICRLIPTRVDFKHQHDTPQDAAGHVKSALVGSSIPFIINEGKLLLGSSQGIYFLEFDGPRRRQYYIKIQGD